MYSSDMPAADLELQASTPFAAASLKSASEPRLPASASSTACSRRRERNARADRHARALDRFAVRLQHGRRSHQAEAHRASAGFLAIAEAAARATRPATFTAASSSPALKQPRRLRRRRTRPRPRRAPRRRPR